MMKFHNLHNHNVYKKSGHAGPMKTGRRIGRGGLALGLGFAVCTTLPLTTGCDGVTDTVRNVGYKSREARARKLRKDEMRQWESDLNLSRARVRKIRGSINELVQESSRQGSLAWKIAREFCLAGRYESGTRLYKDAVKGRAPAGDDDPGKLNMFERSLPYFRDALARHKIEPNLLFDAGLCYGNASRALGWEEERWRTAVFLFQGLKRVKPEDRRADYQLALLYGKTKNPRLRDRDRAVKLLRDLLLVEEYNIAARFALGNILTERGEFNIALTEYQALLAKLKELHERRVIGGALEKNRQYLRARENLRKLEVCVSGRPGCEIAQEK